MSLVLYESHLRGGTEKSLGKLMMAKLKKLFGAERVSVGEYRKKKLVGWGGGSKMEGGVQRGERVVEDDLVTVPLVDGKSVVGRVIVRGGGVGKRLKRAESYLRVCGLVMGAFVRGRGMTAKESFMANMSHEIRTPLNSIVGIVSLLQETRLSKVQREYVGIMEKSTTALLAIVSDILDFSRLESGSVKLERASMNVRICMEECYNIVACRAEEKDLDLVWDVSQKVPEMITEDYGRLRQVLVNLLSNAVKFTDRGKVVLKATYIKGKKGKPRIKFTVSDTGIGIRGKDLPKLFRCFTQLDDSNTKRHEGTGLGLAISQHFCKLMGTRLQVKSRWGKGSRFYFFLPVRNPVWGVGRGDGTFGAELLRGKVALVVDDKVENVRLICTHLDGLGMEHRECCDVVHARMYLDPERYHFDVALLDVRMPKVDGTQLARDMRNSGCRFPIVALSSIGRELAGLDTEVFDEFLVKPYRKGKFVEVLVKVMGGNGGGPRILVVEDKVSNRKVMEGMLRSAGYARVEVARHGKEAVRMVKRSCRGGDDPYDVIFMDIKMPYMDGAEATRRIRKICGERQPKIIAQTAAITERERKEYEGKAVFDGLVTKPITNKGVLEKAIREVVGGDRK